MPFRELVGTYRIADAASHVSTAGSLLIDSVTQQVYVENGVTPGTLLESPILVSTTYLTSAQLNASNTPIEILPSPGVNRVYVVHNVTYLLQFGTLAYSGDGGGAGLWYGESISVDTGDNAVFAGTITQMQQSLPYSAINSQSFPFAIVGNSPINFWSPNSPLSGGDGTGIITFTYQILG